MQRGEACWVKSCDNVKWRAGYLVKESNLEIATADCAVSRASSEVQTSTVLQFPAQGNEKQTVVMPSSGELLQ